MRARISKLAIITTLTFCALPAGALADTPKLQGTNGDWQTYTRHDGTAKICYVLSKASAKTPTNVRHGDIYFMVASWKSGAAFEQPSFLAGFPLKITNPPAARVGSTRYPMYASGNEAFIEETSDERRLVNAMRAGSTLNVTAMSERGTNVSYTFSLKGITAALTRAKAACA